MTSQSWEESEGKTNYYHNEEVYLEYLSYVLKYGDERPDRTGTGTLSLFGLSMTFDLRDGFPLLTTKKVHWKSVVHELLWFIRGDHTTDYLKENGVTIWDEWEGENNSVGPMYGWQMRNWGGVGIDQLSNLIKGIKADPYSRRHVMSTWNVEDLQFMALNPCHGLVTQFYVKDGYLSCQMYQRSADMFLGMPFNIASYALLTHMIAQVTGLKAGLLDIVVGDAHIYLNHLEQAKTQLKREPYRPPTLKLDSSIKNIDDFRFEHIELVDYKHHPAIKAPVAV